MRKGKTLSKAGLFPIIPLVLSPPYYHKFFCEDLQLSSFFCKRTASPLTDHFSITNLITIIAVCFFSCLPTSAEKMIEESLSPHWVTSGIIKSCHRFSWFNVALLNQ